MSIASILFTSMLLLQLTSSQTTTERNALLDLYGQASGLNWRRTDNWNTTKSICTWYGVTCSNTTAPRRILQFSLYDNLLEGTIPSTLSALDAVEYFALSTNKLHGSIPTSLGLTFTKCQYFDLRYNFLNGTFPMGFSKMTKLTHFVVSNNEFTDSINLSKIIENMKQLTYVDVRSNQLKGTAPTSLCNLANLSFCGLVNPKYHTNNFNTPIASCLTKKCIV
jgi:Leucine-rich repeat (LRR) protein